MNVISEELYFEAADLANELSEEVGYYCSKKMEHVKCYDIESYVNEVENVEFIDYDFKDNLSKKMLGSITKVHGEIIITTNQHLMLERKNFTKMHEIIHYYRDVPYLGEAHAFSDMILEDTYLPEDYEKELRANIGASILMANDQALPYALRKFRNFNEVANYFFMSKAALRKRILQYLEFTGGCTYETAYKLFKDYYYKSGRELLKFLYKF
ncbi:ImmA/IrrE family metallo-endopeptidase [Enterococcus faecium]|nr:ImmA/IrrE family metallo-endopeptidase [Enterococcus faecium]MDQ8470278.1 ImmA/IrrE family metallo-endopeptidase [Enterococcus faecium]MDQ8473150.1 ImmA/IrrE family metallo-endopeptidase [Enterococcus faecium]NTM07191.1 ImmA/IrrE family metallo-endopeptidase [Enterococcus faecium]